MIGSGFIIAEIPRISKILAMLLPNTLPMANSELPLKLAKIFTSNSGREVPKETMVRPITMGGQPNRLPIEEAPSTSISAPLIRITKPTTNKTYTINYIKSGLQDMLLF